jgi:hypothetical protein
MAGLVCIILGAVSMLVGTVMLTGWVSGRTRWIDARILQRSPETSNDWVLLGLYFIGTAVAPLLGGALLIVLGLRNR